MSEALPYAIALGKLSGKSVVCFQTCQHSGSLVKCGRQTETVIALEDEDTFYIMMPCENHLEDYVHPKLSPALAWEIIK